MEKDKQTKKDAQKPESAAPRVVKFKDFVENFPEEVLKKGKTTVRRVRHKESQNKLK
ncbi:MAG: hypothetical protein JRD05_07870 [Deltaproteobacteria bacterium]|nr:hypothetical protein [Deltaproteobacteria bacterium]